MRKSKTYLRNDSAIEFKNVMLFFGYKKTHMFIGRSFIYGCNFYETEFEQVFITDYDMINDLPLNDKTCIAFSTKTKKSVKFSVEFMEEQINYVKNELQLLNEL